jgi:hypothetical protein
MICLTAAQLKILYALRGTGLYVGKDALYRGRIIEQFPLRTRLHLRKRGLIEYSAAGQWHLTEAGKDLVYRRKNLGTSSGTSRDSVFSSSGTDERGGT